MHTFSWKGRPAVKQEMKSRPLDLLVIGGGITGAGILLDAQVRGLNVALIEMQDFAAGTSSRSTKLVHGGLRYLKQLEVKLVAEVGKERATVYENGPHVTTPEWMLLPIIQGGTYGKMASSVGLSVYDRLAGVKRSERRQMLNLEQTVRKEPLLRTEGLKGSGYYVEYRTDDARLTLEIMKEAVERGALALNYTKAEDLIYENGKLVGVQAHDLVSGETFPLYAKRIVNATGPWVDHLREIDGSKQGKMLHHTKGVHLVVDHQRFPLQNAVYFDVPGGRMLFAIPRDGKTYVGTTDTNYKEDLVHPRMTREDRDYILEAVNSMFPSVHLTAEDVESSWAGVRPLIHEEGKDPSEISRKDEIFRAPSGLITIAGGKLTGYRKMAEKVVNLVAGELRQESGRAYGRCSTDKIAISGGKCGGAERFRTFLEQKTTEGINMGLTAKVARKWSHLFGTNVDAVYANLRQSSSEAERTKLAHDVLAALIYSMEQEMTMTPSDFFIRRTGSLFFDITWVRRWQEPVIAYMAERMEWTPEQTEQHRRELTERMAEATEAI